MRPLPNNAITYKSQRFLPANRVGKRLVVDFSAPPASFSNKRIPCNELIIPRIRTGYAYYVQRQFASWTIFCNQQVLPYYLKPMQGAPRHVLDQLRDAVYAAYSPNYNVTRRSGYMYHIAAAWWCDDLGRFYKYTNNGFEWSPLTMRYHNDRPTKQITNPDSGETLTLPAYWWVALAGLRPTDAIAAINSSEYDVHHVDENPCDYRPSHLQVVPTYLHRRHHTVRTDITEKFFRYDEPKW